jgi:hypothetical protein
MKLNRVATLVKTSQVEVGNNTYTRYKFTLSSPVFIKRLDTDEESFICTGLLGYLCPFTYDIQIGFMNQQGDVQPSQVPNKKFMTHERSLFQDIAFNLGLDSVVLQEISTI